jgi:UDPglucose 6-dehydrogenase
MVLIGECDERAGRLLESIHRRLCDNDPKVCRMNFFNAELTKIALNSYCTMKISFANTIAQICGNMPGGNACSVLEALGADSRIGAKYLQGALSYGGPCFPRDNRAFSFSASRFGCEALLAKATDEVNRLHREQYVPESILEALQPNPEKIAVLGITYKPDTPVVEESAVLHAVRFFLGKGIGVNIYDPLGLEQAQKELRPEKGVRLCRSVSECLEGTEACFVATPWREFIELKADDFIKRMKKPVVVDAWNLYSREEFGEIRLLKIGIYRNEY